MGGGGLGREPFYTARCPETRCFATADRNLKKHEDFDAIFFHQRSLDWDDIPDRWMNTFYTKDINWDVIQHFKIKSYAFKDVSTSEMCR